MAQHDYIIANQSGAAFRADLNNSLAAIVSQNSGAAAPSTTYAYMPWADTANGLFKIRNAANSAWITLYQLDGEWSTLALEDGTAAAPSLYFKDSGTDTGIYSPGADQVAISTGGGGRLFVDSSGNVGLGVSAPDRLLHLSSTTYPQLRMVYPGQQTWDTGVESTGFYTITRAGQAASITVDTSNRVGIGTTSPSVPLQVLNAGTGNNTNNGAISLCRTASVGSTLYHTYSTAVSDEVFAFSVHGGTTFSDTTYTKYLASNGGVHIWYGATNATERARIDSSGRLGLGTSSPGSYNANLAIYSQSGGFSSVLHANASGTFPKVSAIALGSDAVSYTYSTDGGTVAVAGSAHIAAIQSASVGASTDIAFLNTESGSVTEQMRLTSAGLLQFNSGYGSVATAYGCRAWVNFNGTGTVAISGSGNVSSITDNGVGDYTVNFTTAMPDANYVVTGMGDLATGSSATNRQYFLNCYNAGTFRTSSLVRIASLTLDATAIDSAINQIAIFR